MKNSLRFALMSILMLVCGNSFAAEEVVFDFTGDDAFTMFGLPGFSSGTGESAVTDGDFTETLSTTISGVTLTVTPSEEGKTANRMWSGSLRLYSGAITISSSGENITAIKFSLNSSKWGEGNTADTGNLEKGKWSGDAKSVTITISANTQIKSMTVILGGESGGETPEPPTPINLTGQGTLASPYTAADAIAVASALEANAKSDQDYYIKGKISNIQFFFDAEHGTATFSISDDGSENNQFLVYGTYYLSNRSWQEGDTQIALGDEVIIYGQLQNFKGTTPETVSKKSYVYSLNGVTDGGSVVPVPEKNVTVAEALTLIEALEDGKKTSDEYTVKGYVVAIEEISAQYGNATFDIADEKGGQAVLKVYRCKGFNGEKITDENLIKVDDLVEVKGLLQKYVKDNVTTPELATGGQIVSINGQGGSAGVETVKANTVNGQLYNLAGQRINYNNRETITNNRSTFNVQHSTLQPGLYIQNGRKFIVK